jgi:hypothetical protein
MNISGATYLQKTYSDGRRSLPRSIVCDNKAVRYGIASAPPVRGDLQHIEVTTLIACSERNDLYSAETPSVEVEDQLHRGRFFFPTVTVIRHDGDVVVLRFDIPPGAYDLGMRLPYPSGAGDVLGCDSSARFAVIRGHARHLTFLICSCGAGGGNRGLAAGRMELGSMNVAVSKVPRTVRCGADIPDPGKAVEGGYGAVLDGGIYYGTYNP